MKPWIAVSNVYTKAGTLNMQALARGAAVLCIALQAFHAGIAIASTVKGSSAIWGTAQLFRGPVKVITDIDDTIVSSGGHKLFGAKLFGVDNQYKRGEFYPGVIQFVLELAHANPPFNNPLTRHSATASNMRLPSNVCILTARAKELKLVMAIKPTSKIVKAFRTCATACGKPDWGMGDVHYGSFTEIIRANRRGWRKFTHFERMVESDAKSGDDRQYVFIGDTGDRDEDAAQRMATKYPHKLRAVFLHHVFPVPHPQHTVGTKTIRTANRGDKGIAATAGNSLAALSASASASISPEAIRHALSSVTTASDQVPAATPSDRYINGVPLYYFRTYIGAAAKAHAANLIDAAALRRVVLQAAKDMRLHEETSYRQLCARLLKRKREALHPRAVTNAPSNTSMTFLDCKTGASECEERTRSGLVGRAVRSVFAAPAALVHSMRSTGDARLSGPGAGGGAGQSDLTIIAAARTGSAAQLRAELARESLEANLRGKWADLHADARLCGDLLSAQFLL
jgi:hypothetical protein